MGTYPGTQDRYVNCERSRVPRRLKDVVLTIVTLVVLFGTLVSINPRLREQTEQFASHPRWDAIGGTVAQTVVSGTTIVEGYAGDNTYLFWFLIAACVFVVLMLKVIS